MKNIALFIALTLSTFSYAQQHKIQGRVVDSNDNPIPGANIVIEQTKALTITDFNGNFSYISERIPVDIEVSYIGYKTQYIRVKSSKFIKIVLEDKTLLLEEMVISASRNKEKIDESPASIELLNAKSIKQKSNISFYHSLVNLKSVQSNEVSITFQSINTRGFSAFNNERFLQLIDGVDNASPAMNFPLGNLIGTSELDVESVEILPGASSALYGANAFNGVMNIISKNPFKYKGLSSFVKYGMTRQKAAGTNPYTNVGLRFATASKKIGFKLNVSYLNGTDWLADDNSDIDSDSFNASKIGTRESNPSYDGVNVYGDEVVAVLPVNNLSGGALDDIRVSRTGYAEKDLVDNNANNLKANIALHYRPTGKANDWEIILDSRMGTGKTIHQGANRYVLDKFMIHMHKLEVKNKYFFVRGYYTGESAADSYDTRFTAWNLNRQWRSDKDWFTDYAAIYTAARLGMLPGQSNPMNEDNAHIVARDFADNSPVDYQGQPKTPRLLPGTEAFKTAFNKVVSDPNFITGGKFVDNTTTKHVEGNFNSKNLIKFANIQVGGSYNVYSLNSDGTIFTDYDNLSKINIDEMGAYLQITKKLFNNRLKLTNSVRYDRQMNFKGHFSPRASVVVALDEEHKHNLRFAYQTGFRNPTTQNLYIGLNLGYFTLVGAAPDNFDRYKETVTNTLGDAINISGNDAYNNAYTLSSVKKFSLSHNPADLEVANINVIQPEQVSSLEMGYRANIAEVFKIDFSAFYSRYNNFIKEMPVMAVSKDVGDVHDNSGIAALANKSTKAFFTYVNEEHEVRSFGADIGLKYQLGNYTIDLIYDFIKLDANEDEYKYNFNTPNHKVKISFANPKIYRNIGFKINYRYFSEYKWGSSFAKGLIPERNVLDAQINYNIRKANLQLKIGGSNVLGTEYKVAPGAGYIGSMYYFSIVYQK
jgi:outer membrane receptor protein involved in Fe transport